MGSPPSDSIYNHPTLTFESAVFHFILSGEVLRSMAVLQGKSLALSWLLVQILSIAPLGSSHNRHYTVPAVARLTDMFAHVSIDRAFNWSFGASNIQLMSNGSAAYLSLTKSSGEVSNTHSSFCFGAECSVQITTFGYRKFLP